MKFLFKNKMESQIGVSIMLPLLSPRRDSREGPINRLEVYDTLSMKILLYDPRHMASLEAGQDVRHPDRSVQPVRQLVWHVTKALTNIF